MARAAPSRIWGFAAWRFLGSAIHPLAPLLLRQRAARGKEDPARLPERLGIAGRLRPPGRLVWVHGASVGESLAAIPLIERLLGDGFHVLATSGTVTSATLMAERLPLNAIHQYVPLDTPKAAQRFLDYWRPEAALFVESDLWPTLIQAARKRGVRLALINARMSERSARGWQRAPKLAAALLNAFDVCLAQDEEIADRFVRLGAPDVRVVGSLKADAAPLAADPTALSELQAAIGGRPILLAAQTHAGEDETILPAHDMLRGQHPGLLTIIVPRHPARGDEIAMLCGARMPARRALAEPITPDTQIYIADTLGELGLFYRLAPFCFLGGTLVPMGGHNPLEPAALGCAVLAGPHRASAHSAYNAIFSAQGFGAVGSAVDIARVAGNLLTDPATAQRAGGAARQSGVTLRGAVEKTATILEALLANART